MNKGFTLIEMIVAVSILAMVLIAGTTIFYRVLYSSDIGSNDMKVNMAMRNVLKIIEKKLTFAEIEFVGEGTNTRTECLKRSVEPEVGIEGKIIGGSDVDGKAITFDLDEENHKILMTTEVVEIDEQNNEKIVNSESVISPSFLEVKDLKFLWSCKTGENDKLTVTVESKVGDARGNEPDLDRIITKEVVLLNSGLR